MSARTLRVIAAEHDVLDALADGPKSSREIGAHIRDRIRAAWCERHGFEIEWETDREPLAARLLSLSEAEENGIVARTCGHQIDPVVRRLERQGRVTRIQIDGHRPILWAVVSRDTRSSGEAG